MRAMQVVSRLIHYLRVFVDEFTIRVNFYSSCERVVNRCSEDMVLVFKPFLVIAQI